MSVVLELVSDEELFAEIARRGFARPDDPRLCKLVREARDPDVRAILDARDERGRKRRPL